MPDKSDQKPWKRLRSEPGPELPIFKVRYDWLENPRNSNVLKAVVLDFPDWVSIAAITSDNRIVTVRQYRFGVEHFTTELPAGLIHPGEPHRAAAERNSWRKPAIPPRTGYTWDGSSPTRPTKTTVCTSGWPGMPGKPMLPNWMRARM